jgi:hypothetical protein
MADNIDNVLKYLKELSVETSFNILIPSLGKEGQFKQLNTEQLKELLETIGDVAAFNNNFNKTFYKILKENLITPDIDIDQFTIYDTQYIALQIRSNCLSENYTVYFTEEEVKTYQLQDNKHELKLKEFIEHKTINSISNSTITENKVQVTCKVPTLKDENDFIEYFATNINTFLDRDVQSVIGEIFLYEIAKSVKDISLNDTKTDFFALTFKERIDIVKQLPTTLTGKIIAYIETYKQALYDLYLVNIETQIQDQTVVLQKQLPYNGSLFNY